MFNISMIHHHLLVTNPIKITAATTYTTLATTMTTDNQIIAIGEEKT